MAETKRPARADLGKMLSCLLTHSGLELRAASRASGVRLGTLRSWREGKSAPEAGREHDFWLVVRVLQQTADSPGPTNAQWKQALDAAQQESAVGQARRADLGVHRPAQDVPVTPPRDRASERAVMDAFVRNSGAGAPAYLCWYADSPVGKTSLLADYVLRHRPAAVDVLHYFVSPAHHTDTLAAFEEEMVRRIGTFLGERLKHAPREAADWDRLFGRAAARSRRSKRSLLLVVDAVDDDRAWSGRAADSIAGMLPASPPRGMRVVVSLRSGLRPPDDLPPGHPLRDITCRYPLGPVAGAVHVRQPRPEPADVGMRVAGLLAVSGGGLRTAELAELAEVPADRLDRLIQGPAGRSLVLDDPVAGTYRLADRRLERVVEERLGDTGAAECRRTLRAWSGSWRDAGWPEGTPSFLLAMPREPFSDYTEHAAYVLDPARLHRLSVTAGAGAVMDQLTAFEESLGDTPAALSVLVPLASARDLVRRASREVPDGAPALMARLGDTERARGLALSAPVPTARAVHLAELAVELAHARQPSVDAVVREAVTCFSANRADHDSPAAHPQSSVFTRLLSAAREIGRITGPGTARPLLLAVIRDPGAGTSELGATIGPLDLSRDLDLLSVLVDRAEMLSAGDTHARAAAVDLWGALARATPVLSSFAGDRIQDIYTELDPDEGLGAVDVLAAAASALALFPAARPKQAAAPAREALAQAALAVGPRSPTETGPLPEEDQIHHALKGILAHLAQALRDTKATRADLRDFGRQLDSLRTSLRVGAFGDLTTERARWILDEADKHLAEKEREAAAEEAEQDEKRHAMALAKRRERESGNNQYRRNQAERKAGERSGQVPAAKASPKPRSQRPPAPRRTPARRRTWGLPALAGDAQTAAPHLLLLQEVDERLSTENSPSSRAESRVLLDAALREAPRQQARGGADGPLAPELWSADLCQALGTVGGFDAADALVAALSEPAEQARHLAALALGCALGGHGSAAAAYATAAREGLPDDAGPVLAAEVNQALAYARAESTAAAPLTGGTGAQRRQAEAAMAVGLARHRPEEAVRLAEGLAAKVARRIAEPNRTGPFRSLPELAALLLATPDAQQPGPRLREALHQAVREVAGSSAPRHAPTMTVLTLLGRLGCLSDESAESAEAAVDRWRRSLRPGPDSGAEVALLAAVEGDIGLAWRHAESLRTPAERSLALGAVAAHLAGVETAQAIDPRAADRTVRICLALARAAATGDGPSRKGQARHTVRRLLRTGAWSRALPALPGAAPQALPHLARIALYARRQGTLEPDTASNGPPS
ncbi:hypothetical protein ACIQPQ_21375 [Streptomyces sp. NPDC091281]|uniref:hypothetical protein n=1 Tax=Streptomyces sp. NPDC091281 TaxID=3365985 RepID=UPI00381B7DC2